MRIYNPKKKSLNLPLAGNLRITIQPEAVSGDILISTELLSLLVTSYNYEELALIVSGPFEINMCASVSGASGFVVQSLEEAIERFAVKNEELTEPKIVELPETLTKVVTESDVKNPEEILTEETKVDEVPAIEKIKIKAIKKTSASKKNEE